jgi:hypothetical protein
VPGFPEATDRFHPAEDFLDSLPYPLADGVTGVPSGTAIDG